MAFVMRTTKPEAGNKYYITKANGGYSGAIKGSPTDKDCDVLANCVGYAYGRFNEIGGYGYCKYLKPVNAENFMNYKGDCKTGQAPKVGACMVWRKGTSSGSDGAGHVAIVEKVISSTEVITSESGYGSKKPFWNSTRKKGSGNWGAGSAYTFLGFIYNPAVPDEPISEPTKVLEWQKAAIADGFSFPKYGADGKWGSECETVAAKAICKKRLIYTYQNLTKIIQKTVNVTADGKFGSNTEKAVISYQKTHNLTPDGCVGPKTWKKILNV